MSDNSEKPNENNGSHSARVKITSVTPILEEEEKRLLENARQLRRTNGPPYLKQKLPPKTMKISTVTVRKRNQSPIKQTISHKRCETILPGLKDCIQSRPPLNPEELSGPTVFSYDPPRDRPEMTSFPSYTFRPKTQCDRAGGGRTAWGKEWFSHNFVWLNKADFDPRMKWPSPAHYSINNTVGVDQPVFPRTPSHTFGKRQQLSFTRRGIENEPGPNAYGQQHSKDLTMRSQISFTIPEARKKGTVLWKKRESVPGPGSYEITHELANIKPRSAAFSFSVTPRKFDLETRCSF